MELIEDILPLPSVEELHKKLESISNQLESKLEAVHKINKIINIFDEKDQIILTMKYFDGKTFPLISEEIGCSESYVRNRHTIIMEVFNLADKLNKINY